MTIGFGIIGCGMISEKHAAAIKAVDGAELVACCSRSADSAKSLANKQGCQALDTVDQLLAHPDVDAVTICTPSGAHLEPALLAASAGKHVVIEKPLEVTLDKCDQIIDACRQANVLLTTIFQSRFQESSRLLKQAVDNGRFGTLALANAYVKWHRTQEYYDSGAWRGTWELDGGGALMNQAIHNIDLLTWIMGPVAEISAQVATLAHQRIEVEDVAVASLKFANGALGTIEATTAAFPGSAKRLEVYGSTGSAIIEDERIALWRFAGQTQRDEEILEQHSAQHVGGAADPSAIGHLDHARQFENFCQAIQGTAQLVVDGSEARKSVEIILAIYESAGKKQTVAL